MREAKVSLDFYVSRLICRGRSGGRVNGPIGLFGNPGVDDETHQGRNNKKKLNSAIVRPTPTPIHTRNTLFIFIARANPCRVKGRGVRILADGEINFHRSSPRYKFSISIKGMCLLYLHTYMTSMHSLIEVKRRCFFLKLFYIV